jgi:hypothetical protein
VEHALHVVLAITEGKFSLRFVIVSSIVLLCAVILLASYMILFRAYHKARSRYRAGRAALYHPAIEQVLMEEPVDAVVATLQPRRWGDLDIVQEVMIDSMRHLEGPPFETLKTAAERLGLIEKDIEALRSPNRHRRGRAMDALGVMRSPLAIPELLASLDREQIDLKLVALRALAAIGDPSVLPAFDAEADRLPPTLLPRLISLVFEFRAVGRRTATAIINRHAKSFPPAAVRDILLELAADFEAAP